MYGSGACVRQGGGEALQMGSSRLAPASSVHRIHLAVELRPLLRPLLPAAAEEGRLTDFTKLAPNLQPGCHRKPQTVCDACLRHAAERASEPASGGQTHLARARAGLSANCFLTHVAIWTAGGSVGANGEGG